MAAEETRTILVFGDKTFQILVPADAKMTFAPFSPPSKQKYGGGGYDRPSVGTLRIYQGTEKNILAVFSGVTGFRDTKLEYMEEVAKEEGATIWKSDEKGYMRESKVKGERVWTQPEGPPAIAPPAVDAEVEDGDDAEPVF